MKLSKKLMALTLAAGMISALGCSDNPSEEAPTDQNSSPQTPTSTRSDGLSSPASTRSVAYKRATLEHPAQNVPVPKFPDAGKRNDDRGREAIAKTFLETQAYVKMTGKPGPLHELIFEECTECLSFYKDTRDHYKSGGWVIDGDQTSLEVRQAGSVDELGRYPFDFIVVEEPATVVRFKGKTKSSKKYRGAKHSGTVWVQYYSKVKHPVVVQMSFYNKERFD